MTNKPSTFSESRIGFSSCCFPSSISVEEILKFCLDHDFGAFEIEVNTTNFDPGNVHESTFEWIRNLSAKDALRFSVHSPGNINLSDPEPAVRAKSEKDVKDALELAARLQAVTVVVHPGRVVGEFSHESWQAAVEHNVSALQRCALRAQALGVSLSVENLCHEKGSVNPNIDHFLAMCRAIDLSRIGITLDTNHAGLVDGLQKSVEVVGRYVNHIHFSSNKGIRSDHCEPAVGVIDFHAVQGFFKDFTGLNIIELNEIGRESGGAILRTRAFLDDLSGAANSKS